eukprot:EG_transcript_496
MRLGVIFVLTLAVSVILSSTATWALTFSTSYSELRDMSNGFAKLATLSVDDFAQLVWQLIIDSSNLTSSILEADYRRSMTQMNTTQLEFLHTTIDLMARARNTTAQAQALVVTLLGLFGAFVGGVIDEFSAVGTDYASRLRIESASRAQTLFSSIIQSYIGTVTRQVQLYEWGAFSLNRSMDQPQDASSCTLLGLMCTASAEVLNNVYLATASGGFAHCDVTNAHVAYSVMRYPGAAVDRVVLPAWPPYASGDNMTQWKAACLSGSGANLMNVTCPHGVEMAYPTYCNGTCGYDPRCQLWYTVHTGTTTPQLQMTTGKVDVIHTAPMITLSYPLYSSGSSRSLLAVVALSFFFSAVDQFLSTMSNSEDSQLVVVILNTSDLLLVGTSLGCPSSSGMSSAGGVPLAEACDAKVRGLSPWLAAHRWQSTNASLELNGTLWDVFPSLVATITYFVVVGMNKTQVYAAVDAANEAANATLRTLSQQQYDLMAATEAASLKEMDAVAAAKVSEIQQQQVAMEQAAAQTHLQAAQLFNASRQKSAADLNVLISGEMSAIENLKDYHLSQVVKSVGVTFGAGVGIFAAILLFASYGTWVVAKQVHDITMAMEDVANMKVESVAIRSSAVKEVERIALALGILVQRLAEYKSYMPAGLFQQQEQREETPTPPGGPSPPSPASCPVRMGSCESSDDASSGRHSWKASPHGSLPRRCVVSPKVGSMTRLLRRNVAAMVVNIVHFQAEMAQRSPNFLENTLNQVICLVHRTASKAQGNVDAVLGDQVLVTFNAHFGCSDPPTAASNVAVDLLTAFREEFTCGLHIQVGLAAGPVYAGHLGYAQFKAMVAVGAPMKVASLLSHFSDFDEHVVLVCPYVAERVKYQFTLQPVDLVTLPALGTSVTHYAKGISVFTLLARAAEGQPSQEWLYEVNALEFTGAWTTTFRQVAKALSRERAREDLERYLQQHPSDLLARRLLCRLALWQPRVGIVVAERPDVPRDPGTFGPQKLALNSPQKLALNLMGPPKPVF